ncbi:MAG: putative ankyrin repeat protein L25 [Satyrvirus sp.]|uniref:Putative ankyrin repeat protein L25 n=1 Tax=Satyrvirus sp. TaxID=2487771 RepID=A0A3G5AEI7_9VIRU|nr:MAG: putative ankyrin repeat protein L25 [Satyrvirus sp.]
MSRKFDFYNLLEKEFGICCPSTGFEFRFCKDGYELWFESLKINHLDYLFSIIDQNNKDSFLCDACIYLQYEIIVYSIQNGANPRAFDDLPLIYACKIYTDSNENSSKIVKLLVDDFGSDINARNGQLLEIAINNPCATLTLTKLLLERGAVVTEEIISRLLNQSKSVIELFIDYGLDPKLLSKHFFNKILRDYKGAINVFHEYNIDLNEI